MARRQDGVGVTAWPGLTAEPHAAAAALRTERVPSLIWGKLYRNNGGPKARDLMTMPLPFRLFLIATELSQRDGHCPFAPDELQSMLPKPDGDLYSPRSLNAGVSALKDVGLLAPAASRRCLLLPVSVYELKLNRQHRRPCQIHSIYG